MDIAGSVALVTGGASGLGAATVRTLFDAGASVVLGHDAVIGDHAERDCGHGGLESGRTSLRRYGRHPEVRRLRPRGRDQ